MSTAHADQLSFPALDAQTRHFSVGAPRTFSVSPDGSAVYFLRTASPDDRFLHLWKIHFDEHGAQEALIVDVAALLGDGDETIPEAERQRRERMREASSGITAYDLDARATRAAFALSGALYVVELAGTHEVRRLGSDVGVIDPRLSPSGERVAYVCGNELRVIEIATGTVATVATASEGTTVGLANFVAAEELDRVRGHWWSPDSSALLFEVADNRSLDTVWIFDPKDPRVAPASRQYPKAGTANPALSLVLWRLDGTSTTVTWDERFEYLVTVSWPTSDGPLLTLMTRDHREQSVVRVTPDTGALMTLVSAHDDDFLEWTPGLPAVTPDGRVLVSVVDRDNDTYRVGVVSDGVATPFSPVGVQIAAVVSVTSDAVLTVATTDATSIVTARVNFDGHCEMAGSPASITRALDGVPGGTLVSALTDLTETATTIVVSRPGSDPVVVPSFARSPRDAQQPVNPSVRLLTTTEHQLAVAVLLPTTMTEATTQLPIIMSPYGGPHYQRVLGAGAAFALDQWIADQGFCVVVADGRGTGGRGPAWDRTIVNQLGALPVADQVEALDAVVAELGELVDATRVGIRGWSFGGYLAARCVLERPDKFHAAVAGAPVTDFAWYDTGYTERYLGHPDTNAAAYEAADLIPMAAGLRRPLMFIHGFNDDNVLYAHTQLLSDALLAAGAPHHVLSLSGVTHMPTDPVAAENMVQLQLDFFRDALR